MDKKIVQAYVNTLLWTSTYIAPEPEEGGEGEPLVIDGEEYADGTSLDDLPIFDTTPGYSELFAQATEDLEGFQAYCKETVGIDPFRFFDPEQVAHDFCLSRNGHGAGFFDDSYSVTTMGPNRGAGEVEISQELQAAAKTFGTHGLMAYINNDGAFAIESHG